MVTFAPQLSSVSGYVVGADNAGVAIRPSTVSSPGTVRDLKTFMKTSCSSSPQHGDSKGAGGITHLPEEKQE